MKIPAYLLIWAIYCHFGNRKAVVMIVEGIDYEHQQQVKKEKLLFAEFMERTYDAFVMENPDLTRTEVQVRLLQKFIEEQ